MNPMYLTLQDLHYFLFQSEFQEKGMFTMAYLQEVHFKRNSHLIIIGHSQSLGSFLQHFLRLASEHTTF